MDSIDAKYCITSNPNPTECIKVLHFFSLFLPFLLLLFVRCHYFPFLFYYLILAFSLSLNNLQLSEHLIRIIHYEISVYWWFLMKIYGQWTSRLTAYIYGINWIKMHIITYIAIEFICDSNVFHYSTTYIEFNECQ